MKRFLSMVLLILCAFLLSLSMALAENAEPETFTSGDYQYTLLEDGTAVITSWNGNDTELSIPSALDGHPVTRIGNEAFFDCISLTSVSIPDSVASIGDQAFHGCPNLTATVGRNSYAEQYCKDNSIPYTYPDSLDWLNN